MSKSWDSFEMNWGQMSQEFISVWNHEHMKRHTKQPKVETSAQTNLDSTEILVKRSTELEYEDLFSNKPKNLNQLPILKIPSNLNQVPNLKIPSNF